MSNKKGKSIVGVGIQFGDEGKLKVFDRILENADVCVRYNGGTNAGGTLEVGNLKFVTHGLPGGVLYLDQIQYVGSGAVLNSEKMNEEIRNANAIGAKLEDRLKISSNISLVQPHHILLDSLKGGSIGTTGNGIGPAYADQAQRQLGNQQKNIRFGDFVRDPEHYAVHVESNLRETVNRHSLTNVDVDGQIYKFMEETLQLEHYLCDNPLFLEELIAEGKTIFMQGVNSTMLDVIKGDSPYVTSSRTLAAAAYTGGDLSLRHHDRSLAVGKAIMSRVGNGPFISEFGGEKSEAYFMEEGGYKYVKEVEQSMYDPHKLLKSSDLFEVGIGLRMLGNEYGATTKRPRRMGMLDLVQLRQQCLLNGIDELYLNKFDCLTQFAQTNLPGIPIVTAYELDGETITHQPTTVVEAKRAKPVVEYIPHISQDISSITRYEDLPNRVHEVIETIESYVGIPIFGIGTGPKRKDFVSTDPNVYQRRL